MEQHINITSEIQSMCEVELFLNSLFKELKFSRKIYCKMYLALNEAVINALIHGNKKDPSKLVQIDFIDDCTFYSFTVKDQGQGFDFLNIQNPVSSDNIYKESGRGIFIMKQYSDKVLFEDNGRKATMIFNK